MAILIDQNTKVIVQGITGSHGSFHAKKMVEYGTKIVGGVTPGKGGMDFEGTNVKEGKEILAKSKLKIISADAFADAARKAVAAVK